MPASSSGCDCLVTDDAGFTSMAVASIDVLRESAHDLSCLRAEARSTMGLRAHLLDGSVRAIASLRIAGEQS